MNVRSFFAAPFLALLLVPHALQAQGKATKPTVVLRINSIDSLIGHVKFLVGLAGQEDAARQIEGLIKTKIGQNGLEGVDAKRPFGFYGRIGKELDDVSGVVLLPIADETAFLNLLKNLNVQVVKGGDGIHTIKTGTPIDAYLRFVNKYAYVTALHTTALEDKNLLDPAKVLAGKPTNAFALTIQLDQVPEAAKFIASAQAEQFLQNLQDDWKVPGETAVQKAARAALIKEVGRAIADVFKDGAELKTEVDLDPKDLSASFAISGMPKSELAVRIENIAKQSSLFGGMLRKDALFNGLGHVVLPDALVKALGDVVEEARTAALANIQDAAKKQQAEALFKVLGPTLKSGDCDGALVLTSGGKHLTAVTAFKVTGGVELGRTIHALVSDSLKGLPADKRDRIKLDADAVGTTKIHKVELPIDTPGGRDMAKVVGEPNVYVAFRQDAVFLATGTGGLEAIKEAIPVQPSPPTAMLFYQLDVARLAAVALPDQVARARQVFPGGQGGMVSFRVEGGAALSARLNINVAVLQFLGQVRQMRQGKDGN